MWVTTDWGVALWSGREWVESRFPPGTSHGDGMVVTADGKLGVVVAVPAESSQWESDYEIHWGEAPFSGNVSGWAMGSRHKPDLVAGPDGDLWALVTGDGFNQRPDDSVLCPGQRENHDIVFHP